MERCKKFFYWMQLKHLTIKKKKIISVVLILLYLPIFMLLSLFITNELIMLSLFFVYMILWLYIGTFSLKCTNCGKNIRKNKYFLSVDYSLPGSFKKKCDHCGHKI